MPAWYTTVERVAKALGAKSTAYNEGDLRRAVAAASADVDDVVQWVGGCFRPNRRTVYFDWPARQTTAYYKLYLDANPLLSAEIVVAGGAVIPPANYNLEPQAYGPPYRRIEINRGTSSAFSYAAGTPQRAVGILGLWGIGDDQEAAGTLAGTIDSAVTTISCSDGSKLGIGDHIMIGTERLEVTNRSWVAAATLDTGGLASSNAATVVPLTGGTVAVGELLLVDGERVMVVDVAGSTVVVQRAQDGTPLAAHLAGATVYARRGLTVTRGAQGTLSGGHSTGSAITRHVVPGDVEALTVASAIVTHLSEQAGYSNTGSGSGETKAGPSGAANPRAISNLDQLRGRVLANYGRQIRTRVI